MALISGFRGIHYNTQKIPNLADVITPPYDVISKAEEPAFFNRSPYNFAHLILAKRPDEDYSASALLLKKWRELDILRQDSTPCYYLYRQNFTVDGRTHSRDTLMAAVQLHDFSEGVIRPHENTHGKYKADRLQKLRQTKHNLSHIFGMVKDPEGFLESTFDKWEYREPLLRAKADDGVEHVIWRAEEAKNSDIAAFFSDKPIYIVDGHHRYESALAYAREAGTFKDPSRPSAKMLFAIANTYDPGLLVFPTHRIVAKLERPVELADIEREFDVSAMTETELRNLARTPQDNPQFGLWWGGKLYRCLPKHTEPAAVNWGYSVSRLAVAWSDHALLRDLCGIEEQKRAQLIAYERNLDAAWARRNEAQAIVFHATPLVEDVLRVADENHFMPQKSTFFFPKLAAGLILRDVSG